MLSNLILLKHIFLNPRGMVEKGYSTFPKVRELTSCLNESYQETLFSKWGFFFRVGYTQRILNSNNRANKML